MRGDGGGQATGVIGLAQQVGDGTQLTAVRMAAVFKSTSEWRPIQTLAVGSRVVASGPPVLAAGIEMLPIRAAITPDGVLLSEPGAVQMSVLALPAGGATVPLLQAPVPPSWAFSGDKATPKPAPAPRPPRPPTTRRPPTPAPPPRVCAHPTFRDGYKLCKGTYCGQDLKSNDGTRKVADDAECRRLCNEQSACAAYEIYGGNADDCTLRPACNNPLLSDIGTLVAFKVDASQYDCSKGEVKDWSEDTREWCCFKANRGCGTSPPPAAVGFDCDAGYANWMFGWSDAKKVWCCRHRRRACPTNVATSTTKAVQRTTKTATTTESDPFDCAAGYQNYEVGWSVWKKRWCCSNYHKGCPDGQQVTGSCHIRNVIWNALESQPVVKASFNYAVKETLKELAEGVDEAVSVTVELREWATSHGNVAVHFKIKAQEASSIGSVRDRVTVEALADPLLDAVMAVPNIGSVSRVPIHLSDCLIDLQVVSVPCTCSNGKPKEGSACPGTGGHFCDYCDLGYKLVTGGTCEPNVCTCEDGIRAQGAACHTDNQHVCGSCMLGFHLEKSEDQTKMLCKPNVCTCVDGTPATGEACASHQGNICQSCGPGYHVDETTYQCKPNVCSCTNGIRPQEGSPLCIKDEAEICESCFKFHHLDAGTLQCEANTCTCEGGRAALGEGPPGCFEHMRNVCVDCDGDLHLRNDYTCGQRECVCRNGTAAMGEGCITHHGNICSRCDANFVLTESQCVTDRCTCANGEPLIGEQCVVNGAQMCDTCHDGYRKEGVRCVPNICKCENGRAAEGAPCLQDGLLVCAYCDEGYHHDPDSDPVTGRITVACAPNTCDCENGMPATQSSNPKCVTELAKVCVACDAGYSLTPGHGCQENQCTCSNGQAGKGKACLGQGVEDCASCDPGFHITQEGIALAGTMRCRSDGDTTSAPFDCMAGFGNRFLGWSLLKKHWCCEERSVGCDSSQQTGEAACEGKRLDAQQCSLVGCCTFVSVAGCLSAVGQDQCNPSRVIMLKATLDEAFVRKLEDNGEAIKVSNNMCLSVTDPMMVGSSVVLQVCNQVDIKERWVYDRSTYQLKNDGGLCLQGLPGGSGAAGTVTMQNCEFKGPGVAISAGQQFMYVSFQGQFITSVDQCLSVQHTEVQTRGASVILLPCASEDTYGQQEWSLPATAEGTWTSTTRRAIGA